MIRAVVFDLWNTLVRSQQGDPFQHLQRLLGPSQEAGFKAFKRDAMVRTYADAMTLLTGWQSRLGLDEAQIQVMTEVFRQATEEAEVFPETMTALLETRKVARVALLSNTQSFDMAFLERLGLTTVVPNRFLSAELGCMKPDPEPFAAVQNRLGLFPGELAMVGDSWRDDVLGALEAGWTAIWVNRSGLPRPEVDPEALLVEVSSLEPVPAIIRNLQAGARCSTCLG